MELFSQVNLSEYPTIGAAALFLIGIGLGFIPVWLFPRYYGWLVAFAFTLAAFGAIIGYSIFDYLGRIRTIDILVYSFSLAFEIAGIIWVSNKYKNSRIQDAMILLIVALHFIPMILILGPWLCFLTTLCTINAILALYYKDISILPFGLIDSVLKTLFGVLLIWLYAM